MQEASQKSPTLKKANPGQTERRIGVKEISDVSIRDLENELNKVVNRTRDKSLELIER